jgi:hypothetical protein
VYIYIFILKMVARYRDERNIDCPVCSATSGECFSMQCIMCFEYLSWRRIVACSVGDLLVRTIPYHTIRLHDKWSKLQCSI